MTPNRKKGMTSSSGVKEYTMGRATIGVQYIVILTQADQKLCPLIEDKKMSVTETCADVRQYFAVSSILEGHSRTRSTGYLDPEIWMPSSKLPIS